MIAVRTTVVIVGGGPVGLTASTLLSQHGIENVVVERRADVQRAPAAHVLRPHAMAVFERIGAAEAIRRARPDLALDYIVWCTAFGGRDIGRLDIRRGVTQEGEIWTNCPQNVLEPILLDRARQARSASIWRGAECSAVEQDDERVRATVRHDDGSRQIVEARWLIAADGAGSPVRRMLDIPMVGPGPQGRFFMVHFEADLRPFMKDREGPLYWIMNPEAAGTFIVHDPARSTVYMTLCSGSDGEQATIPARLDAALGVPAAPRILSIDTWSPHVQIAARYREGRAFLIGDAAHRFPPTGGLGLNTGIVDADFLVHQIARVENDGASARILDVYEAECRPVAQENADQSFENMKRLGEIGAVLGACRDRASLEARIDRLDDHERAQLASAIERQRSHFTSDGRVPQTPRTDVGATLPGRAGSA